MLNLDEKNISKALIMKFKKVFPVLISPGQSVHFNGRFIFIGSWRHLFSDIIEIYDIEKLSGYFMKRFLIL